MGLIESLHPADEVCLLAGPITLLKSLQPLLKVHIVLIETAKLEL